MKVASEKIKMNKILLLLLVTFFSLNATKKNIWASKGRALVSSQDTARTGGGYSLVGDYVKKIKEQTATIVNLQNSNQVLQDEVSSYSSLQERSTKSFYVRSILIALLASVLIWEYYL